MMTIGGYVLFGSIAAAVMGCGIYIARVQDEGKAKAVTVIISIVLCAILFGVMLFYYQHTARGVRSLKDQESNLNKGVERVVRVYDIHGEEIQRYEGKFDIQYDETRILFDDQANHRHTIYPGAGTVIIDEK